MPEDDQIEGLEPDDQAPSPGGIERTKEQPVENQMLDGIKNALKKPEDDEVSAAARTLAAAKKPDAEAEKADATFEATLKGKTPEEIEAAKREAEAKKKPEDAGKAVAKKADDFKLTDAEKAVLKPKAGQRFHELHQYAKEQESQVQTLTQENTQLRSSRDKIMNLFEEHLVEPDDLSGLLDYNKRLKSGDLAGALQIVNEVRTGILKALGKEEPGVDLLSDFPDLAKRVEDYAITREDALVMANARRREQALEESRKGESAQQQSEMAVRQAQDGAMASIEKWTADTAAKDIDYKKKETKVLGKLPQIIKDYPPHLWLPTIQAMYESVEVVKEVPVPRETLRPSGARPGAKEYKELTPEALRAGLGYPAV